MLRPFAHPVGCCCVLLRKVWNRSKPNIVVVGATMLGVVASVCTQPEKPTDIILRRHPWFPRRNNVWETSAEIPNWWCVTIQVWVVLLIGRGGNFASINQKYYPNLGKCVIANEQPREDARLRGGSIIRPCAEVPREKESRSDVTYEGSVK